MKILEKYNVNTFRFDVRTNDDGTKIEGGVTITIRKLHGKLEVGIFEGGSVSKMYLDTLPGEISRTQAAIVARRVYENYKNLRDDLAGRGDKDEKNRA